MTAWIETTPRYCAETDSIDLVTTEGVVMAKLKRNTVIKMVGMLLRQPPAVKPAKSRKR